MSTIILIDGDILLYQICAAAEQPFYWGDDLWTLHADEREVREQIDNEVTSLKDELKADKAIIALSGETNWRKIVLPTYKANRKGTRKPVVYKAAKEYVRSVYTVAEYPNVEADDVLGIYATDKKIKGKKIIVSADKDLKTIPGFLYNPEKSELGIQEITNEQADWNHMYQTLVGDTADGYTGCPGIGPKTAEKVLGPARGGNLWEAVTAAYSDAGLGESEALVQARVARILRHGEYDVPSNFVHLWSPNESRSAAESAS
jgi:5'-3' exonuclease